MSLTRSLSFSESSRKTQNTLRPTASPTTAAG